jgi:hypothetical protein
MRSPMVDRVQSPCRLCGSLILLSELRQHLCPVCDEYAQHVALQTNKGLERIMGDLQSAPTFRAASRQEH